MNLSQVRPVAAQQVSESKSTVVAGGIDILDDVEVAEMVEYTIPFPVTFTWDMVVDKQTKKIIDARNARFFTSKLKGNKSFECRPVLEPGTVIDAFNGESGTLVVRYADNGKPITPKVVDGHTHLEFTSRPEFVSFNGRKAVKYTDAERVRPTLLAVMRELYPESAEAKEKKPSKEAEAK